MKYVGKKSLSFVVTLILFFGFAVTSTYAASVGGQLTTPADGWQRIDDRNKNISYTGSNWNFATSDDRFYDGTYSWSKNGDGDKIEFTFVGTSLRVIGGLRDDHSDKIAITIDGETEYFSEYKKDISITEGKILVYEKIGLEDTMHTVEMRKINKGNFSLDAIDINAEGSIVDINAPTPPTDPTQPEEPSNPEPEEPTTPEQPSGDRAIMVVTLTTGLEKEFDLSMKEVNDFISWYEAKQSGSGRASYAIDKHNNNKGPFSSRKDYVLYDRILTFEVNEYSK